ncbi:hypothetical protein [Amycolatopsis antarctica]|nr:hypothetical protein [Amycolatopsis antarctica]
MEWFWLAIFLAAVLGAGFGCRALNRARKAADARAQRPGSD